MVAEPAMESWLKLTSDNFAKLLLFYLIVCQINIFIYQKPKAVIFIIETKTILLRFYL